MGGQHVGDFGINLWRYISEGSADDFCATDAPLFQEGYQGDRRDLLPFPVYLGWRRYREHAGYQMLFAQGDENGRVSSGETSAALDAWLQLIVRALNAMWSGSSRFTRGEDLARGPTPEQVRAFWHIERKVTSFLATKEASIMEKRADHVFSRKEITYGGEMVSRAQDLTWDQVEAALPPKVQCASVDVLHLCDARMQHFFQHPKELLMPLGDLQERPRPGRVRASPAEATTIGKGLLRRGLVRAMKPEELIMINGEPLLNGLFGVEKDAQLWDGRPHLRLIMNLTASNAVMVDYACDIGALPYYGQWRGICLTPEEDAVWSFDDLRGAFYLLSLPPQWAPVFAFNMAYRAGDLELAQYPADQELYLGATTLPMGWKHAMGVMQYLHRRLLAQGVEGLVAGLPRGREVRKDRVMPPLTSREEAMSCFWQVYCDDADYVRLVRKSVDFSAEVNKEIDYARVARSRYAEKDFPLSAKNGTDQGQVVRLGALVDGRDGRLRIPGKRIGILLRITCYLLDALHVTCKQLEIVLGHWVHCTSFRRETMSLFTEVWPVLMHWGPSPKRLPVAARREFCMAIALLPLFEHDLRAPISDVLTASDACEHGGGVVFSTRLTPAGLQETLVDLSGGAAVGRDFVGILELGSAGAGRQCMEHLGIEVAVHGLLGCSGPALRAVRAHWPDAMHLGPIDESLDVVVKEFLDAGPHLTDIIVFGMLGEPFCMGPCLYWAGGFRAMEAIRSLRRQGHDRRVWHVLEGIASPDPEAQLAANKVLRCRPCLFTASQFCGVSGQCLVYINFALEQTAEMTWHEEAHWLQCDVKLEPMPCYQERLAAAEAAACSRHAERGRASLDCECELRASQLNMPQGYFGQIFSKKDNMNELQQLELLNKVCMSMQLVPLASFLVSQWAHRRGWIDYQASFAEANGQLSDRASEFVAKLAGKQLAEVDGRDAHLLALESMVRGAIYKGSDVRLATSTLVSPASWPRRGVRAGRWCWKTALAFPQDGDHINVLEARAALSSLKWRLRRKQNLCKRAVLFCDSQVVIAVVTKGRSSSRRLQRIVSRISSLCLAGSVYCHWVYVRSKDNPADEPSRNPWGSSLIA